MESEPKPIIVVIGQTASGKSALAMKLAKAHNGEIIAADSRTIYKGMDIGTAKPPLQDQQRIKHYGLDLITPDQYFSAAEFKNYTSSVVKKIHKKNKIPFIVGGTGLYVDGYIYDFPFGRQADLELRKMLESLKLNELQEHAEKAGLDPEQVNFANPRHLARAIERGGIVQARTPKPHNIMLVGLEVDREQLLEHITNRVDTMFEEGLVQEVQNLITQFGAQVPGLLAPAYKEVTEYINGSITLEEAKEQIVRSHKRLAKRQLTWFKRNKDIIWCATGGEAEKLVSDFLTKFKEV
jgi:tRNA dimethylallyltransferase